MTRLRELWERVKDFFKNMSMRLRIILCAAVVVIVAVIVALVVWSSNQPYTTLFTNLSSSEASAVIDYLQENGYTDYRLEGNSILVRQGQEDILTAQLLMAGYPKDGYLYETYFEKVGLTTTNSERNEIMKIALQERLGAIIRNFDGVQEAYVTINLGRDQVYVLEDVQTKSTADVFVKLVSGYTLTNEQAVAIRNLVSHSVRDLNLSDVSIEDGIGNTYTSDAVANLNDSSQLKLALQEYYSNKICTSIVHILEPVYGEGNVKASVICVVDVNRRVIESEEFSQPEGSKENSGLIGTSTILGIVSADGIDIVGGIPGTTTNSDIDIPTYMEDLAQADGEGNFAEWYKKEDANINKTTEQVEVISGTLVDVQAAVTINANSQNGTTVLPNNLSDHIATAAGIGGPDPDGYVSVLLAPFNEPPAEQDGTQLLITPDMIPYLVIGGAVLLVLLILLILILSIRRKRKQKKEEEQAAIDAQLGTMGEEGELLGEEGLPGEPGVLPGEPPVTGADIMEINTEKTMELRKSVRQFVQNNPEIAAQMIKNWLRGGEDDNG